MSLFPKGSEAGIGIPPSGTQTGTIETATFSLG